MTRACVTQTRSWTYSPAGFLFSSTLPETGTTTYTYNSQSLLASKTDAKLLRIEYSHDAYNRLTEIRRFDSSGVEQTAQRTNLEYDTAVNGSYPNHTIQNFTGQHLTYEYDALARPNKLTLNEQTVLAGQLQYNTRGQLTRQTQAMGADIEYISSPTANEGRLWKRKHHPTADEIEYQYDDLGRLTSAATTGAGGWGQSFTYDGFSHLTQQTVTKGSAPAMSLLIDPSTNRVAGQVYDANSNSLGAPNEPHLAQHIENRLVYFPSPATASPPTRAKNANPSFTASTASRRPDILQ
jgi:YD repeat-containing protein